MSKIENVPHVNATVTASGNGPAIFLSPSQKKKMELVLSSPNAPTGTSPTLTLKAQTSPDNITYTDLGGSSIQLSAAGHQRVVVTNIQANWIRSAWVIGGSASPTFTGVNSRLTGVDC